MTDNKHSITPPPELVDKWFTQSPYINPEGYIATQAAQWGADQELEACCEWFQEFYKTESWVKHDLKHFRAARRPNPPSLKEQALQSVKRFESGQDLMCDLDTIRRALEALDD